MAATRLGLVECPKCGQGEHMELVGIVRFNCRGCGVQLLVSGGGLSVHAKDEEEQAEEAVAPPPEYIRNERRDLGCRYDCADCKCDE